MKMIYLQERLTRKCDVTSNMSVFTPNNCKSEHKNTEINKIKTLWEGL